MIDGRRTRVGLPPAEIDGPPQIRQVSLSRRLKTAIDTGSTRARRNISRRALRATDLRQAGEQYFLTPVAPCSGFPQRPQPVSVPEGSGLASAGTGSILPGSGPVLRAPGVFARGRQSGEQMLARAWAASNSRLQ